MFCADLRQSRAEGSQKPMVSTRNSHPPLSQTLVGVNEQRSQSITRFFISHQTRCGLLVPLSARPPSLQSTRSSSSGLVTRSKSLSSGSGVGFGFAVQFVGSSEVPDVRIFHAVSKQVLHLTCTSVQILPVLWQPCRQGPRAARFSSLITQMFPTSTQSASLLHCSAASAQTPPLQV